MGLELDIPGRGRLALEHLVLDVNGTLTDRESIVDGVAERLHALGELLAITILSADTYGSLEAVAGRLGVAAQRVAAGSEKAEAVVALGAERCAAIGNGRNDAAMLEAAALGIVVIGREGAAGVTVGAADVVCCSIVDALDLLLDVDPLVATLRA